MEQSEKQEKMFQYEITYLDDINMKHLAIVDNNYTLNTIKERFTVLDCREFN